MVPHVSFPGRSEEQYREILCRGHRRGGGGGGGSDGGGRRLEQSSKYQVAGAGLFEVARVPLLANVSASKGLRTK